MYRGLVRKQMFNTLGLVINRVNITDNNSKRCKIKIYNERKYIVFLPDPMTTIFRLQISAQNGFFINIKYLFFISIFHCKFHKEVVEIDWLKYNMIK